jgi:hypothetical protein
MLQKWNLEVTLLHADETLQQMKLRMLAACWPHVGRCQRSAEELLTAECTLARKQPTTETATEPV